MHLNFLLAYDDAMDQPLLIRADWDSEAKVWVATSTDVPGLATEAETLEALEAKLLVMVPELLEANGQLPDAAELSLELQARRVTVAPLPAH